MELKELRDKINELEKLSSIIQFQEHMSSEDYARIDDIKDELKPLYKLLEQQDFYYVEEQLNGNSHISYLDNQGWHSFSPHAFISEEEAKECINKEEKDELEKYSKLLYTRSIKKHLAGEAL